MMVILASTGDSQRIWRYAAIIAGMNGIVLARALCCGLSIVFVRDVRMCMVYHCLLQIGCTDVPIRPQRMFHPCRRCDIKTTAAVFCLSSSGSTVPVSLYNWQAMAPCHIRTVTRGLQTASQDFPIFSFLPGHSYMTCSSSFFGTSRY